MYLADTCLGQTEFLSYFPELFILEVIVFYYAPLFFRQGGNAPADILGELFFLHRIDGSFCIFVRD